MSEVQLEEAIQPAGRIDNIKKNRHHKMMSCNTQDLNQIEGSRADVNRLTLRLMNLREFNVTLYKDTQSLTHLDLRNNRLSQLPE